MWDADKVFLAGEPTFEEILDSQQQFFANKDEWEKVKKGISANMLNRTSKTITLKRMDDKKIQVSVKNLSDGALLIVYKSID